MAWSVDALKDYTDARFKAMRQTFDRTYETFTSRMDALANAHTEMLTSRQLYLTKDEYDSRHAALEARLELAAGRLEQRLATLERWQAKILGALALVIFITPILTGLIVWLITDHRAP